MSTTGKLATYVIAIGYMALIMLTGSAIIKSCSTQKSNKQRITFPRGN